MTLLVVFGSIAIHVVLLVVFGIAMARMTRWLVRRMVERRHRELEDLTSFGRIPVSWSVGTSGWASWRRRRRLDALTVDVRRSALVADEETRRVLLDRLAAARERL